MAEDNNAPTGDDAGEAQITREIVSANRDPSAARRVREAMNRANDANAKREQPAKEPIPGGELSPHSRPAPERPIRAGTVRAEADPSDPTQPVVGPLEIIESVVRNTQRYGAFQYWPSPKKEEALGLVTRTAKQLAIAERVVAVARRDTVHGRAYRERKRLKVEAQQLLKAYGSATVKDASLAAEALDYYTRFVTKVASLPTLADDDEDSEAQ